MYSFRICNNFDQFDGWATTNIRMILWALNSGRSIYVSVFLRFCIYSQYTYFGGIWFSIRISPLTFHFAGHNILVLITCDFDRRCWEEFFIAIKRVLQQEDITKRMNLKGSWIFSIISCP